MTKTMLCIIVIIVFTIGYLAGRYQQRSIDEEIPILFWIKKDKEYENKFYIKVFLGEWMNYWNQQKFWDVKHDSYNMYFQDEQLSKSIEEKDYYCISVNVANARKLKKGEKYLRKLLKTSYQINVDNED